MKFLKNSRDELLQFVRYVFRKYYTSILLLRHQGRINHCANCAMAQGPPPLGAPRIGFIFHTNEKCMLNNGTCKNARLACTFLLADCRVQSQSMQYVFGENRGYIDRMMGFGPLWATAMYGRGHLAWRLYLIASRLAPFRASALVI